MRRESPIQFAAIALTRVPVLIGGLTMATPANAFLSSKDVIHLEQFSLSVVAAPFVAIAMGGVLVSLFAYNRTIEARLKASGNLRSLQKRRRIQLAFLVAFILATWAVAAVLPA